MDNDQQSALPPELQQMTERISESLQTNSQRMDAVGQSIASLKVLEKLECSGQAPDLSSLSEQELNELYELGMSNRGFNQLPDDHPHSLNSIKDRQSAKQPPPPLTSEQKREGILAAVQSRNFQITPVQIAAAQVETAEGLSRDMGGKYDAANQDIMNLKERAAALNAPLDTSALKAELHAYKEKLNAFENSSQGIVNQMASRPGRLELENLSRQDHTPADVQKRIDSIKEAMGARQLDLRGLDMSRLQVEGVRFKGCTVDQEMAPKQIADIRRDLEREAGIQATPLPGLERISKLAPQGGMPPDLAALDRADLEAAFDHVLKSPNHQFNVLGPEHPFSQESLQRASAADFSDEQLRTGIGDLLQARSEQNMPLDAGKLMRIQNAEMKEFVNERRTQQSDLAREYENLAANYPELADPGLADNLKTQKQAVEGFAALGADQRLAKIGGQALAEQVRNLGPGADPAQVAACFQGVTQNLSVDKARFPISDLPPGTDLSQARLNQFSIDTESLARCNGLDGVSGVNPRQLAEAQAIKPHVERLDDLNARLAKLENKGGVIDNLRNLRHGGVDGERKHLLKEIDKAQEAMAQAKQGVEAQFPRVQNEFEPKAVYEVGGDVTRRQEAPKDPRLEALQASVTFRLDSESALNNQGGKVAFAKAQIGTKSADMQANGAGREEVQKTQMQEWNAFGSVAPLHGTSAAVNDADFANAEAMKAAVGSDISSLLTRSVATSAVDKALGMNCMAQEAIGIDEGGRAVGISVGVAGAPILKRPDSIDGKEAFLDINYSDPAIQKGLYDLEAQDYITGQIDRHTGNIFIDPHTGQVSGIDNDLAFPTIDREDMIRQSSLDGKAIPGKPQFMHSDTAAKIEALTPEALREALQSIERPPGVAPLEPAAIDGAVHRLQELQAEIKDMRKEGRVVDQFDEKTFEAAIKRQDEKGMNYGAVRTSYLAAAILEKDKSISLGEKRDTVQKESVPEQAAPDPKFAAYQQGVQDAKAQVAANPNLLQDAGLARSIQDSQTRLASLQDELAEQNRHLTATGARLDQARMDGDADLVEGFTEIYDNAQQARQDTLQKIANEQRKLDAALDQAVEPRKEQIAQQARQAVQQVDVVQQVKVEDIEPEESVEIPLTESEIRQIEEAEQNLGPADYHVEIEEEEIGLGIEEENPGIQMVEVPNENVEIQDPEASLQNEEPKVDLEPAVQNFQQPSPAVESPQEDGPRTRLQSVRDALKGAASTVKSAAVERLDRKGDEQSLKEVRDRSPELIDKYKELQKELSNLKKLPAADGPNKIDAALGDADAYGEFKKGSPEIAQREKEIKAEMAQMKEENPGLAQLDRSKVGQVVHSGVRDAAKSAANKLR